MRLMEGADIYQIAKNCRTSVEMIERHYAVHLKNTLDASAINVLRPKPDFRKRKRIHGSKLGSPLKKNVVLIIPNRLAVRQARPLRAAPSGAWPPFFGLGPLHSL